jgi:hypothetical protein
MTHYAISEFLIVLTGLWASYRLARQQRLAAMFGTLFFTFAAGIGVFRFGLDRDGSLIEALAPLHQFISLLGGSAAMMVLVYDLLDRRGDAFIWRSRYEIVAVVALTAVVLFRPLAVPVFFIWSLGFVTLVVRSAAPEYSSRLRVGTMAGLMLIALLVFRQASWLSPALSWHIFHGLVAVWLLGLGYILVLPRRVAV